MSNPSAWLLHRAVKLTRVLPVVLPRRVGLGEGGFHGRLVTNAVLLICLASKSEGVGLLPPPARAEVPPGTVTDDTYKAAAEFAMLLV